jgi:hypothetical protein
MFVNTYVLVGVMDYNVEKPSKGLFGCPRIYLNPCVRK